VVSFLSFASAARANGLERIQAEGVLRWGADPSGGAPFCFNDPYDPGQTVGFEVELVERLARRMKVRSELVVMDWNTLIPSLHSKRIDLVLNGMEVTDARKDQVAFTTPYFQYVQQATVRAEDQEKYPDLDALKGHKIAVLNASASIDALQRRGWRANLLVQFDDSLKPYEALKAERVDGVVCESIITNYYAGKDKALYNLPDHFSPGVYAAAVRPDDRELLHEINRHLEEMKQSGELGELYQRWGIWSERQEKIGIVKGQPQEENELAQPGYRLTGRALARLGLVLLKGAGYTLLLTALSMPMALMLGLLLAVMVRSGRWWLTWPAGLYIQVIRGTPLLVQVYVIFFTLPLLGQFLDENVLHLGVNLLTWPAFAVGVLCLTANYAAYEAEIHRAGLDAVPKGQREAALALGMSERQAFFHVILPQSLRIILPPVFNDLISMLKDSCIVSVVGVAELLFVAQSAGKATFLYGQMLLAAAVLYLVMSLAADLLGKRIEARLRGKGVRHVEGNAPRH
jgi:polar amino acid transport system substrate-binding protein